MKQLYSLIVSWMKKSLPEPIVSLLRRIPAAYYSIRGWSPCHEPEMQLVSRLASTRGTAIDIGANTGVYTEYLAQLFNAVYAFEPQSKLCGERLVPLGHKYGNIYTYSVALSDHAGMQTLFVPVSGDGHSRFQNDMASLTNHGYWDRWSIDSVEREVSISLLDTFEIPDVTFIKIDVEGHELAVIRGAKATIARYKPVMLVEIQNRLLDETTTVDDVVHEIESLGYDAYFMYMGGLMPYRYFRYKQMQHLDAPRWVRGIDNFYFIPR